jgi:hypothetical protein
MKPTSSQHPQANRHLLHRHCIASIEVIRLEVGWYYVKFVFTFVVKVQRRRPIHATIGGNITSCVCQLVEVKCHIFQRYSVPETVAAEHTVHVAVTFTRLHQRI